MKYADEEIIKLLNQHKKMTYGTMEEGVMIHEKKYTFKETGLYDDKIKVLLPESFHDMEIDVAKMKYPMEQRPTVIKTNEDCTIDITFNLTQEEFHQELSQNILDTMMNIYKTYFAGITILGHSVEENQNGTLVGWFDYLRPVVDGRVYSIFFFFEVEGKILIGGCLCQEKNMENWKPVFMQMINSIKVEHEES